MSNSVNKLASQLRKLRVNTKRRISSSRNTNLPPKKKQRKNNYYNTFRHMNNRVMATIPHQHHIFMNIMQQYYRENPRLLYKYQRAPFEMPTRNEAKRRSEIYKTHQALKRRINAPGKTKNNPILL